MELKQTIVMRKGKMIAQGAHASLRAIFLLGHLEAGNFIIRLIKRSASECAAR